MKRLYSIVIMSVAFFAAAFAQTQPVDSISYLFEHARNNEPWAYEALAECYRYGKGVDKSIANAMIYYDESDVNASDLAEKAYESDPTDELGFMNYLMNALDHKCITIEETVSLIDNYPKPLPKWAVRIKAIFSNQNVGDLDGYIKSSMDLIDLHSDSADELVVSIACLKFSGFDVAKTVLSPLFELKEDIAVVAGKIPVLYGVAADRYWARYEDCPEDKQAMKDAFEFYHKAYLHGLLPAGGVVTVLDYRDSNQLYEGFPFSKEEMENLDQLGSKEYRIRYKEPCVIEVEEVEE